ncbi:hypothetical protein [Gluconacetobacter sp.]|uniref:hypothetical protein n=1 Tax=Gluconacetobacter sp. TaxID=1935994 RepID=UPI0039ECB60A
MIDLLALWSTYGGAATTVIGGVGGWYANMARLRLGRDRAALSAGQQALGILERSTQRDARMDALLRDLTDRVADLMRQRWQSDDALQDLYAQAISARLTIQELDAQAGRPPRPFPPLPPYPYPRIERAASMDDATAARGAKPDTATPDAGDAEILGEEPDHAGGG